MRPRSACQSTSAKGSYLNHLTRIASPAGFKAGRQAITYADRRIFGPGEWGNVGRYWWDAAKVYQHTDPAKVDLLYGQRIVSDPSHFNDDHYPFHMAALYAQFKQFTNRAFTVKPDAFYVGRCDTHGNLVGESGVGGERGRHGCARGWSRQRWCK